MACVETMFQADAVRSGVARTTATGKTIWLLWPLLALAGWMQPMHAAYLALAAIILLGVPHGALDGEIARPALRARFGAAWFVVFSVPYLGLAALVLLAWHVAPKLTLAAFLCGSVWHFGLDQPGHRSALRIVARGGMPIALPSLFHPKGTAAIFSTVAQVPIPDLPQILTGCALVWFLAALVWMVQAEPAGRNHHLLQAAAPAVAFVVLPPLTAFALYFVCIHAPEHMRHIACDPTRAPRVTRRNAFYRALPVTALTILIGTALFPLYGGSGSGRLLALTIQGLAALTLPHMLLDTLSPTPEEVSDEVPDPARSSPGKATVRCRRAVRPCGCCRCAPWSRSDRHRRPPRHSAPGRPRAAPRSRHRSRCRGGSRSASRCC